MGRAGRRQGALGGSRVEDGGARRLFGDVFPEVAGACVAFDGSLFGGARRGAAGPEVSSAMPEQSWSMQRNGQPLALCVIVQEALLGLTSSVAM